jgi:hypothetical protein
VSIGFLRLAGAVAGGRTSGRGAGLSWVSVDLVGPVARRRRGAVYQECQVKALVGVDAEGQAW